VEGLSEECKNDTAELFWLKPNYVENLLDCSETP